MCPIQIDKLNWRKSIPGTKHFKVTNNNKLLKIL